MPTCSKPLLRTPNGNLLRKFLRFSSSISSQVLDLVLPYVMTSFLSLWHRKCTFLFVASASNKLSLYFIVLLFLYLTQANRPIPSISTSQDSPGHRIFSSYKLHRLDMSWGEFIFLSYINIWNIYLGIRLSTRTKKDLWKEYCKHLPSNHYKVFWAGLQFITTVVRDILILIGK